MMSKHDLQQLLLVALAAMGGAAAGVLLTWLVSKQGILAGAAPGGLLGMAAGYVRHRFLFVPIVCCIAALLVGIGTEWWLFPFVANESLGFFLTHLHDLRPASLIMIGIGAAIGFYGPYRSMQSTRHN